MNSKPSCQLRLDTKKVKILQIEKGVRNLDIAEQSGFSRFEISRHIQGDGRRPDVQAAIAECLGVSLKSIQIQPATTEEESPAA